MSTIQQHTTRDFPERTNGTWAENLAEALRAEPKVTITDEAIDHIKWLVVDPKQYLDRTKSGYRLKAGVLHDKRPADGKHLFVLKAKIFGCVTAISPHNDRLVGVWPSPFQSADPTHPHLPRRQQVTSNSGDAAAELVVSVKGVTELRHILRHTAATLDKEESKRPYSLTESLANEGQRQAGVSVVTRYVTAEGRMFLTLSAVAGNNRAHHRLGHHGLDIEELVLGVPIDKLGISGDHGQVIVGAHNWIKPHLDTCERRLHGTDIDAASQALKAFMVAAVEEEIVVGADPVDELAALLHTDNVAEHIQSVLAYDDVPRFDALGRQLLASYRTEGRVTDAQLAVLNGDALPSADEDPADYGLTGPWQDTPARLTELRDWRNRTLISLLFPAADADRKLVRKILAEPAPTGLKIPEINHRSRLLAVLQMKGHGKRWNPRAGQIFQIRDGRNGITVSDTPLAELLKDAQAAALSDELKMRVHPFLCARELIVPDRGSLDTIQKDDKGREEPSERRQPSNALHAVAASARGLAFLHQVIGADATGRTAVHQVDQNGEVIDARTADRTWLNSADGFPKITRVRPEEPQPEPEPEPLDDVAAFNAGKSRLLAELVAMHDQAHEVKDAAFALVVIANRDSTLRLDDATYREASDALGLTLDLVTRDTVRELGQIVTKSAS